MLDFGAMSRVLGRKGLGRHCVVKTGAVLSPTRDLGPQTLGIRVYSHFRISKCESSFLRGWERYDLPLNMAVVLAFIFAKGS